MPFMKRPMPGMVYVSPDGVRDDEAPRRWVGEAAAFVDQQPTEAPKRR